MSSRPVYTSFHLVFFVLSLSFFSCQKTIKFNSSNAPIKQVIVSNFYPDNRLVVNISKSKTPSDKSSVEFLNNCTVALYEDGIFKETMFFYLKDTLSGLGGYVSSFNLKPNKTYKVISAHPELGVASAEEFLPARPNMDIVLLQHADSLQTSKTAKYTLTFTDSLNFKNYYYTAVYYKYTRQVVDTNGDTSIKTDYNWNVVPVSSEISNPINFNRVFFTDANSEGQTKTFYFEFPSIYDNKYKTIDVVFELSNVGFNYYDWTVQQIKPSDTNLNEGEEEPYNIRSNIINGYGHFSAYSSVYQTIKIK